ncbi:MAG: zinc transporter [Motiliproteus sp.]|jgi:zinc transporter
MITTGLVHGFLFDGQGGGKRVEVDFYSQWRPNQGVLWLHFDYSHPAVIHWITEESGLDSLAAEALLSDETRPRASQQGDALLVALRGVNLNPGSDPEDMVSIRIWTDGHRIISTRRRQLLSVTDLVGLIDRGEGPNTVGQFIAMLSDRLIARMKTTIEDIQDQAAEIEELMLTAESYDLRNRISQLRRAIISLRRYLAPQREAMLQMQQMTAARLSWLEEGDRRAIGEEANHLIRYTEELDMIRERTAVSHEELANRLAEQLNNRMYALSMVAAVFLPLGFLTGLLGINVGGMPGMESHWAFWIVCALLLLTSTLQVWLFKRKHWL